MEEDLKVKATELGKEFEDIEEVWLLHDVIMVTMLATAARILLFMIR